jgi:hypothetical protein
MNLTQFFDTLIKLQKYGYGIRSIEEDEYKNYFIKFAFDDVCSGLAFGGIQYIVSFSHESFQPVYVEKFVTEKLELCLDITEQFFNMDEAVDFIIADIQEIEAEEMKKERQKLLDKLTPREREILGIKE